MATIQTTWTATGTAPQCDGAAMHELIRRLYPICRSITGNGVRRTLEIISSYIPLAIHEVPTGTQVFDWTVPREWNIRDAWVKDASGNKIVDFASCNLHVVSYSVPVHQRLPLSELKKRLYSLPDHPDWIPYRTSYYSETWGFCLPHRMLESLPEGEYEVYIDSTLDAGSLTYGEYFLPGETTEEVLVSCHVCHPSLCNDNLSGIAIATHLARELSLAARRYSYRFLFIPGTIGSITWLARNQERAHNIAHGLVLTCAGDPGSFTYKKSRRGDAMIDRVMSHVLQHRPEGHRVLDFSPWGYDERQYCSPGFNLPVGCLMRTEHGKFPEYHTSADNLDFVTPRSLEGTLETCLEAVFVLESNRTLVNNLPMCEPQLGRRGLYHSTGGAGIGVRNLATLWVLNLSDGANSLLDIAGRSGIPYRVIESSARNLEQAGLLGESKTK